MFQLSHKEESWLEFALPKLNTLYLLICFSNILFCMLIHENITMYIPILVLLQISFFDLFS